MVVCFYTGDKMQQSVGGNTQHWDLQTFLPTANFPAMASTEITRVARGRQQLLESAPYTLLFALCS